MTKNKTKDSLLPQGPLSSQVFPYVTLTGTTVVIWIGEIVILTTLSHSHEPHPCSSSGQGKIEPQVHKQLLRIWPQNQGKAFQWDASVSQSRIGSSLALFQISQDSEWNHSVKMKKQQAGPLWIAEKVPFRLGNKKNLIPLFHNLDWPIPLHYNSVISKLILDWSIVNLQCVSFKCTAKWFTYTYI